MQWRGTMALVAVLGVAATGCGGSAKPQATADFTQQADTICKRTETHFYALLARAQKQEQAHQLKARRGTAAQVLATLSRQIHDLEQIGPSSAQQTTYTQYKATLVGRRALLAERVSHPEKYDGEENHKPGTPLYIISRKEGSLVNKGAALARTLGLSVCR